MNDIEQLLRMTEHPQDYTDEELQQMMSDPDMRTYYELMVNAEAGFALKRNETTKETTRSKFFPLHIRLFRIAAIFIVILMLSGIAYAAYHFAVRGDSESPTQEVQMVDSQQQKGIDQQDNAQLSESDAIRTFENAELQQILQELSKHYQVSVVFRNEQARHVRLYTKWDTTAPLHTMIERLNGFEKVSIRLTDNQIIAE
ncbi:MAG: DUF4974 domain-containing protein [Prevotella sp.]|nr:DUF4974 domain-containing protein [Prevotella sp.]